MPKIVKPKKRRLRIIDATGSTSGKRVIVGAKNVASIFDETYLVWRDIKFYGTGYADIHFVEPYMAVATLNSSPPINYPLIPVSNGSKYYINNGLFTREGSSNNGSLFQFHNNDSTYSLTVNVYRDRFLYATSTVDAGTTKEMQFKPTLWFYASDDLEGELGLNLANTEMSYLGVLNAQVTLTGEPENYSFSLTNITFA